MNAALSLVCHPAQIQGPRDSQNDSYYFGPSWVIVADGVGGDPRARRAADVVVRHYGSLASSPDLLAGLLDAPAAVSVSLSESGLDTQSTVAAALLDDRGQLWITAVGDSRVAVIRDGEVLVAHRLHNLTDHERINTPGGDPDRDARHSLTRFLGAGTAPVPDVSVVRARPGDVVVAATDGLDAALPLGSFSRAADDPTRSLAGILDELLAVGAENGFTDNATCVLGRVVEGGAE